MMTSILLQTRATLTLPVMMMTFISWNAMTNGVEKARRKSYDDIDISDDNCDGSMVEDSTTADGVAKVESAGHTPSNNDNDTCDESEEEDNDDDCASSELEDSSCNT
jgi:hypothetical protein